MALHKTYVVGEMVVATWRDKAGNYKCPACLAPGSAGVYECGACMLIMYPRTLLDNTVGFVVARAPVELPQLTRTALLMDEDGDYVPIVAPLDAPRQAEIDIRNLWTWDPEQEREGVEMRDLLEEEGGVPGVRMSAYDRSCFRSMSREDRS